MGTTVGSELGIAHIKASWVTFLHVIGIEAFEKTQWWNISACPSVDSDLE